MISPPKFWFTSLPFYWKPFLFLSWLYGYAAKRRWKGVEPTRVPVPVICVGNLTLGGTGKTPVCLFLAEYFLKEGKKVGFLSRGYGGTVKGPTQVGAHHTAREVGDEPLLLARCAPTWVSRNRVAGAQAMVKAGVTLIIMDDGYQNPFLYKDLSLVVVDGMEGFGNNFVFPLGPLREPVLEGLNRADGVVVMREMSSQLKKDLTRYEGPLFLVDTTLNTKKIPKKVMAFCGIGNPNKFFDSLEKAGIKVMEKKAFRDHHPYRTSEIKILKQRAAFLGVALVTTEKDWVRLTDAQQEGVLSIPMALEWKNWDAMKDLLKRKIP